MIGDEVDLFLQFFDPSLLYKDNGVSSDLRSDFKDAILLLEATTSLGKMRHSIIVIACYYYYNCD